MDWHENRWEGVFEDKCPAVYGQCKFAVKYDDPDRYMFYNVYSDKYSSTCQITYMYVGKYSYYICTNQ